MVEDNRLKVKMEAKRAARKAEERELAITNY